VKILVSWLRDIVDVPVAPAKLASDLHMAGFEVASVEPLPGASDVSDDAVIDLEITANRPDGLSVLGIAREVSTLYRTPLREPVTANLGRADAARLGDLTVTIEDPARCPRYCAAVADVRIAPSPDWMQRRLAAAGVRSINNVVDVTNYVLLEIGHPMHAFDAARIGGAELRIRLARKGEHVTTLDGQDRALAPDMLVIADATHATALAGVMGGAYSEVSSSTTVIALESAYFDPTTVRRTAKRLGLSTEASYRFERGADFAAPPAALARACELLTQIGAGGVRSGWIDARPGDRPTPVVMLEIDRVRAVLGAEVEPAEMRRVLEALGFTLKDAAPGRWAASVPTWRIDVLRDIDLIEEIARHYGYDRLPTTFPPLTDVPSRPDRRQERDRVVRRVAASAGFSESVTFSFIARDSAAAFADPADSVDILNPLSELFAVLRPSLLPGLVDAIAHNRRRGLEDVQLFELGTVFSVARGERRAVGLAWTGTASGTHWSGSRRAADFFDLKGAVEALVASLGATATYAPIAVPFLVQGRAAGVDVQTADGKARRIGHLGLLLPGLAASHDVPAQTEIFVAELDLDLLTAETFDRIQRVAAPPRHPAIVRDISIVVDDTLPSADVRGTIRAAAPATLVRLREFDRYQGKGVPDGRVSLSYRLTFQAADRTLTDAEVQRAMDEILQALVRAHRAVQR
jgi:phenylalanyl-tRNA synthetase beta chain